MQVNDDDASKQENNTRFLNDHFIDIACKEVPAIPSIEK